MWEEKKRVHVNHNSIGVDMKPGGTMGGDDWWIDMYCDILFYFNCIGG